MALPYYLRVEIDAMLQDIGASTIFWYDNENLKPTVGEEDVLYLKKDLLEKASWNSTSESYIIRPTYIQSDWEESDEESPAFIKNKPEPTPEPPENGEILYFTDYDEIIETEGEPDNLYIDNSDGQIYLWSEAEGYYPEGRKIQVRSDWNQLDPNHPAYIFNKPEEETLTFRPFITTWNIEENGEVVLPLGTSDIVDIEIDWGDGVIERNDTNDASHTYEVAGEYQIKIKGRLDYFGWILNDSGDKRLIEINQWGDVEFKKIFFNGCTNLIQLPTVDAPNLLECTRLFRFIRDSGITEVPSDLFTTAINVIEFTEVLAFNNLTEIPVGLFSNCISARIFDSAFEGNQINSVDPQLFRYCINARNFKGIFRDNFLTEVSPKIFEFCIHAENFRGAFYNNNILEFPNGIHDNNRKVLSHFEEFRHNPNMTGVVDKLWVINPEAESQNCFQQSTLVDNRSDIPESWGGPVGVPMPPQVPIDDRNYWNTTTEKLQLLINGVWKDVDGVNSEPTDPQDPPPSESITDVISYALSSPTADLSSGDTDSFLAPYDFTLDNYFIGVSEAPSGSSLVVGLKKNGSSVVSSGAVIDSGETSSLIGTSPTITTESFSKGDLITPVISQTGSLDTGKSLKIYLEITKT